MNDTPRHHMSGNRWNDSLVLDPTDERTAVHRPRVARLDSIEGKRLGLLDISKARGDVFLDRLEELLAERGAHVERFCKPTFSRVAPAEILQDLATRCDAVVEALAD